MRSLKPSIRRTIRGLLIGVVAAALFAPAACRRSKSPRPQEQVVAAASWFEDVTEERGLGFTHAVAKSGEYFMPDSVGSGLALLDFDNDGRLDIFLVQNAGTESTSTNALFRQQPNGHFEDVSRGSGLDVAGNGMGVACGDVNNDGWTDVVVTEYRAVRLFLNESGARFREVTQDAGLDNPFWAISASFLDYDRDGWLDLVIANYVDYDPHRLCFDESGQREFCGPKTFPPGSITKLFHNRGSAGGARFEDVTTSSGLGAAAGPGLGVLCADFDGDGWVDIFVANDGEPNRLWINRHDGTFRDEAVTRGIAFNMMGQAQGNMGIALADFDGDNAFDVFVTHLIEETHALWAQGPRGLFQDRTAVSRLAHPLWHGTGFGTVAEDFDNDGAPDIAIANGAVRRNKLRQPEATAREAVGPFWAPYAERNQLFANDGRGTFRDISVENAPFCGIARIARGLVWGDLDGDGGVDLAVSHIANRARLLRNAAPARGNWLLVRVVDPELGGRDAYGAEVTVHTAQRRWTRWCNPGSSYASSNDPRAHFGLGATSKIDSLEVIWPDGAHERFSAPAVNQSIVVRKGGGSVKP